VSSVPTPGVWGRQVGELAAFFCGGECLIQVLGAKTLDCYVAILVAESGCVVVGTVVAPAGCIVRFWNGDHPSDGICGLSADERQECREDDGDE